MESNTSVRKYVLLIEFLKHFVFTLISAASLVILVLFPRRRWSAATDSFTRPFLDYKSHKISS